MDKQNLLQKYLDEECSTEELHLLYQNLQREDVKEYQDVLYKIWRELELKSIQSLDEATFERMYDKIMASVKKDSDDK